MIQPFWRYISTSNSRCPSLLIPGWYPSSNTPRVWVRAGAEPPVAVVSPGEWWQWSLLLASTGPGRLEAGGREDPDWTLVGAAGARGDHRHPASCHSVILSYSNMTADKHIFLILLFCHCLKRHSIRVLTQNFCQTYFIYISRSTAAVKHRFNDNKENQMFNWMKLLDIMRFRWAWAQVLGPRVFVRTWQEVMLGRGTRWIENIEFIGDVIFLPFYFWVLQP